MFAAAGESGELCWRPPWTMTGPCRVRPFAAVQKAEANACGGLTGILSYLV